MPMTPHIERHFTATATVRDIVIGMADGLTVPFALAAGLSGVVASSGIVVTAGLAEIAAGSIAMGLGGYLAARTDADHYDSERITKDLSYESAKEFVCRHRIFPETKKIDRFELESTTGTKPKANFRSRRYVVSAKRCITRGGGCGALSHRTVTR